MPDFQGYMEWQTGCCDEPESDEPTCDECWNTLDKCECAVENVSP